MAVWSATRAGPDAPAQSPSAMADSARWIPIMAASRSIQASGIASRRCDRPSTDAGPSELLSFESRTLRADSGFGGSSSGQSASISSSRLTGRSRLAAR